MESNLIWILVVISSFGVALFLSYKLGRLLYKERKNNKKNRVENSPLLI
jgi:hypothetical protein